MGKEVQQQIALNLLSEGTQITGDLHASNDIRIDGEGNIVSTGTVSLRAKSVFSGTIKAAYIAIESGAVFNGECHIQREVQQK